MLKYQISWKSVRWEQSCSIRTDGRTDMTITVAFRDFVNAPKYISTKWKWRNAANSDCECIYMPATWPACRTAKSKGGTLNVLNENIWFYALNKIWFTESNGSEFNKCNSVQNSFITQPGRQKEKPKLRHCSRKWNWNNCGSGRGLFSGIMVVLLWRDKRKSDKPESAQPTTGTNLN